MASTFKVWVKLEKHESEKVTLDIGADIDDLKEAALRDCQESKRNFCAFFKQSQLTPATAVPSNTSYDEPIVLKRLQLYEITIPSLPTTSETKQALTVRNKPDNINNHIDMPPSYDTLITQSPDVSAQDISLHFQKQESNAFSFEEAEWRQIISDHQKNACIDIAKFLETRANIFISNVSFGKLNFNQRHLIAPFLLLSGGHIPDANDPLDDSFNTIIDEPLNGNILVNLINHNKSLTPFIVDSLKRYHAITDLHSILPKCMEFVAAFDKPELAQHFLEMIDTITTRTLLVVAFESLSLESQRFLGNFIRKNDLPLPLSYYIDSQKDCSASYKINFNCFMEILCLSTDRLYLQAGSKRCAALGKTSLLPYIFTDKRRESLFTEKSDSSLRDSCVDVVFGSIFSSHYVIFDVHGSVDNERNLSLLHAIQLYASVQILYVTLGDLQEEQSFLELMMSSVPQLPTIVCIFDDNFDNELPTNKEHQEQLINRFQNHFSHNHWAANIHWTTVPLFNTARDLTEFKRKRRAERLIPIFKNLFQELEQLINQRPPFRSIFAIQSTYLVTCNDNKHPVTIREAKFSVEQELQNLFEHLSDRTENLKIVSPISYYRSQIDEIRKQLAEMIDCTGESERLAMRLKQLEEERKHQEKLNAYSLFMINLLKHSPYVSLVITEYYLEKWRLLYTPTLKTEKETLKKEVFECNRKLTKAEEQFAENEKENKHPSSVKDVVNQLREQSKQLKQNISTIDAKLSNVDLTIGLMIDELFALYDFLRDEQPVELDNYKADFEQVAEKLAQLVYKGFAIHVLRNRPLLCESGLMEMCLKRLRVVNGGSVAVLTVVGEQSSAKSSLLNATFGCNFRVSAGRCTIGMYLGVAYHKNMTIIIIDTEGLLSLEESGSIFDNQMITMAVLSSHIVLINHKGELSSSLEGLIGMSLYAKLQIQSSPFKPKLMFVLRDQMDRKKIVFFEQLNKFKDNLQHSSSFLRVSIDDELEIRHENIALLPSAFSEDINKDLNLTQRWRNQTFPSEINELRVTIFAGLHEQIIEHKFGYKNIDYFYKKMVTNWKSIDDLGQGLLECKTLYELSVTNELKAVAKDIMLEKSQKLLIDGRAMLKQLFVDRKSQTQATPDIYMRRVINNGTQQLENITSALVHEAHKEFESRTQQKYFASLRGNIQKNIEPSIRCNQQLLQQQFEQDAYTVARESAESQVQKQLLDSAKEFFQHETRTNVNIDDLNEALAKKHDELKEEFQRSLDSMRKTSEEIVKTILSNYNYLVRGRRANADKSNIYNRCPHFDFTSYTRKCDELDVMLKSIHEFLSTKEKDPSFWSKLFLRSRHSGQDFWNQISWFSDHRQKDRNKEILRHILVTIIPDLNQNLISMLNSSSLAYSDPQTVTNLVNYVDNSMNGQRSSIQENYNSINLPQITADLIFIALRLLIDEAIRISEAKNNEMLKALEKLDDWMKEIKEQFNLIRDSYEQGQRFMGDLQKQIIKEVMEIFKNKISDDINLKITQNAHIDPEKIARNAYDNSIGSIPPNADSIMKYVTDINRYYLELALSYIELSAEHIVESQIIKLQTTISECVDKAVAVVKDHQCLNVQEVYQSITQALQSCAPSFTTENLVGISAIIQQPDQFRQSFLKISNQRQSMADEIQHKRSEFSDEAKRACRTVISQRLGCQACCPGCGSKCDNTDLNHQNHNSAHHITMAFKGWRWTHNNQPCLEQCYQNWLSGSLQVGGDVFNPRRQYYAERVHQWLDDLDKKSNTGDLCKESIPPPDQRRAWMAARTALVGHYGIVDQPSYDDKVYPTAINSIPAGYVPKWK
ncbi:unnamed protein product [Rotaria magnacalcarata]|uniref:VLIG-type G domain-containing protein n=1 Tax=Rotaria magnacalcarata TaxID=392030 RepID=A0A815ZSU7_9BILA|nr:unnamed protein product [Rotaria magnacalcarata]CAF1587146.1 unnamed protein product [Rotaria magnacalcarata]CAF2074799.1 unnamed protein product [Rotaria magnacalcarata]CAF3841437.1 unnamed protein product [Rotaria magnacalcarata]CAF3862239.1 unnamed protein product [Rotaria magnacalcarata]